MVASKGTAGTLCPALILATTATARNMSVDIYYIWRNETRNEGSG